MMYGATPSEALVVYEKELPVIKDSLISNMNADIAAIEMPQASDDQNFKWVCDKLYKNMVERIVEKPMRSLKRIIMYQEAKKNPTRYLNSITDLDIQRAREYPIQEIFDGVLRSAGSGRLTGLCPFHADRRASFFITTAEGKYKNKYHCFGCSEHGDSISFMQKMHGIDFISAVRKLI